MSKFNQKTVNSTLNRAGCVSYNQSSKLRLLSLLSTSFAEDKFYGNTLNDLEEAISSCNDPEFVAKALVYTRNELGMRSITHAGASILAKYISGQTWGKDFFDAIIRRPDDATEIISYHINNGQKLSSAMKKGIASAISRFDTYQLAKYKSENKKTKLVDVVNLVHPKSDKLKSLVYGTLKQEDTWESEMVKIGQEYSNAEDRAAAISSKWEELLVNKKLGYFALLRNARNIIKKSTPRAIELLCEQLENKDAIKKSLVLPFRFNTAINGIVNIEGSRNVVSSIIKAMDISLDNMPKFTGKNLVILDVSASMIGRPSEIGSIFTASILKATNADLITFSCNAQYCNYVQEDSTYSIAKSIHFEAGGTNFASAFNQMKQGYDRVFLLSDMQGWIDDNSVKYEFNQYKKRNPNAKLYSFDLAGYGTLQTPEKDVYCLAGFSEKVFDIISLMEESKDAFVELVSNKKYW